MAFLLITSRGFLMACSRVRLSAMFDSLSHMAEKIRYTLNFLKLTTLESTTDWLNLIFPKDSRYGDHSFVLFFSLGELVESFSSASIGHMLHQQLILPFTFTINFHLNLIGPAPSLYKSALN